MGAAPGDDRSATMVGLKGNFMAGAVVLSVHVSPEQLQSNHLPACYSKFFQLSIVPS